MRSALRGAAEEIASGNSDTSADKGPGFNACVL